MIAFQGGYISNHLLARIETPPHDDIRRRFDVG